MPKFAICPSTRVATYNHIFAMKKLVEKNNPQRAHLALKKLLNVQK